MSVLWQSLQRESEAMITQLRELGIDKVQGYSIHKPQPIDDYFQQAD